MAFGGPYSCTRHSLHCVLFAFFFGNKEEVHVIAALHPRGNYTLLISLIQTFQLPPQGGVGEGYTQQIKAMGISKNLKKDTKVKTTCTTPPFISCWVQSTSCNLMTHWRKTRPWICLIFISSMG